MFRPPVGRALRSLTLLIALALIVLAPAAQAAPSAVAGAGVPFDQQFIDMMVPHHQGATGMAGIALTHG